ncbi:MAG: hypothetical protein HYZ63_02320 [Candidatus Andersenbacteria bacterium]|nr:hypothetical protein [Candidatus Andersenbacteria bacterium]
MPSPEPRLSTKTLFATMALFFGIVLIWAAVEQIKARNQAASQNPSPAVSRSIEDDLLADDFKKEVRLRPPQQEVPASQQ